MKNIQPTIVYPVNTGYVNSLKPIIRGTGQPGSTINGLLNGTPFTSVVQNNGLWSYQTAIELPDRTTMTLSITQTDPAGKASSAVTASFRTDTTPLPPHTVQYPANHQAINTNMPTISGTGKPGATIEVAMPDGVYSTAVNINGSWQVKVEEPIEDGFISATVLQKEMGNISQPVTLNFYVDTAPPPKPVLDEPREDAILKTAKPVITGKGEVSATIDATVDDKTYSAKVSPQGDWKVEVSEPLVEDTHILAAKQRDTAGNESPENIVLFTVKTQQPSPPVVTEPLAGAFISQDHPTIKGKGEIGCRVEVVAYDQIYKKQVDEKGNWELEFSKRLEDGTHTFTVYQVDQAGNVSPNANLTVIIDTRVPPAPEILYPQDNGYVNSTVFTVRGIGLPDAQIQCTLGNKEYTAQVNADGSWQFSVEQGDVQYKIPYTLSAKQVDAAGNVSTGTTVEFRVDLDCLPAPMVHEPGEGSTIGLCTPIISGQGKPGATIDLKINAECLSGKVASDGTWSVACTHGLAQGENTVYVTQCDLGNTSPVCTLKFKVLVTPPQSPVISYPAEGLVLNAQLLTLKGTGCANTQINIKLDDRSYITTAQLDGSWSYPVEDPLDNGSHSLLISQSDAAGNESGFAAVNFIVFTQKPISLPDNTPTTCRVTYNPAGPGWTTKTIVTFRTSKPVTVNKVYGSIFSKILSCNGSYSYPMVTPQSKTGRLCAGVTWIDNISPVIQIEYAGNYFEADKTIHYYKPEGAPIRAALLNGTPFESGRKVTEEGMYQVQVTDQAGNTASREFIIDKTPPEISGFVDQMTYSTDVTVSFSDSLSGIQSALLNGQNILSQSVVTSTGDYTLEVTDFAGHTIRKTFHIAE